MISFQQLCIQLAQHQMVHEFMDALNILLCRKLAQCQMFGFATSAKHSDAQSTGRLPDAWSAITQFQIFGNWQ